MVILFCGTNACICGVTHSAASHENGITNVKGKQCLMNT